MCSQLVVFPVLAARHPGLSDLFVCWRRPKGDPSCCGEQRDVSLRFQSHTALLPGQLQRVPGINLTEGDFDINTHQSSAVLMFVVTTKEELSSFCISKGFFSGRYIYHKTVSSFCLFSVID